MPTVNIEMLQSMVQKVLDGQRRHDQDFQDIKTRLVTIERNMVSLKRDDADAAETATNLQSQIDHIGKIERRLDISDA